MRQFPQLRSGAQVQFPLTRRMEFRTLRTAALDGSSLARADAKARRMVWRFPLRNMSEPEWQSLLMLHAECEGSRKEFLFADPTDNLLAESEDLSRPVWQKDAGISVVGSQGDPFGGNRGWLIQNTSSEFAGVSQATALPGSYTTCLSVYARSVAGSTLRLMRESGSEVLADTVQCGSDWVRALSSGTCGSGNSLYRLLLEPGAAITVYGIQVDGQRGPTGYRPTYRRSGVYENARFADEELGLEAENCRLSSAEIEIEAGF
jgi:hypothetical protein